MSKDCFSFSDVEIEILNLNDLLSFHYTDNSIHIKMIDMLNELAENNIGLYIRFMSHCSLKSFRYLEIFLLKASMIYFHQNHINFENLTYKESIILNSILTTIIKYKIFDEIDIVEDKIIIGNDPRLYVTFSILNSELVDLIKLLNAKYIHAIIDCADSLAENDIPNKIRKLNYIYKLYDTFSIFPVKDHLYSLDNSELLSSSKSDSTPDFYESEIFRLFGVLLLPLVLEVKIINDKIVFINEGLGSFYNDNFMIVYQNEEIINYTITVLHGEEHEIYLEDSIREMIIKSNPNDMLTFKFIFNKQGNFYTFLFQRKIGKIREYCTQSGGRNLNININGDENTIVANSNNVQINKNIDIKRLNCYYEDILNHIDDFELQKTEKDKLRDTINQAIRETEYDKVDMSKVKNLTSKALSIIENTNNVVSLLTTIISLKTMLNI